jgi:selenocysteine lyase/cysteine desulfurase
MIARRHLERIRCGNVGWNSVKNAFNYAAPEFELRSTAARFESGSSNMIGAAALSASLRMFLTVREVHGASAIERRVIELIDHLEQSLRAVGAVTRRVRDQTRRSGILTFEVPGVDPAAVRRQALEEKIVVSCRDGGVRASVHAYNDEQDLARLVEVVRRCR